MLGGCLFLTVVFAAALTFELQHVPALGRTHTWVVSTVLAVLATLVVAAIAFQTAPVARGPIWPHVYAALGGFFTMLAVLGVGWWRR